MVCLLTRDSFAQDAFDMRYGVCLCRGLGRLDPEVKPKGAIDVYWLADDGGLCLLMAHLLGQHEYWRDCKVRVFVKNGGVSVCYLTTPHLNVVVEGDVDHAQLQLLQLLAKFRINAEACIISDMDIAPQEESVRRFEQLGLPLSRKVGARMMGC